MSELTPKTWNKSTPIYGQPVSFDDIEFANGFYIGHIENHPIDNSCFDHIAISPDFSFWNHTRTNPSLKTGPDSWTRSNVTLGSTPNWLLATMAEADNVSVYRSSDGTNWDQIYGTLEHNITPTNIHYLSGSVIVSAPGKLFICNNIDAEFYGYCSWIVVDVEQQVSNANILDIAFFNNNFYLLIERDGKYDLLETTGAMDEFTLIEIPTDFIISNLLATDTQLILTCYRENKHECFLLYTDESFSWKRVSVPTMNTTGSTDTFTTLYDAIVVNDQLIVVQSSEFLNNSGLKFSDRGYILRTESTITNDSKFVFDDIDTRHLSMIKLLNNKLVAIGQTFPNPDSIFYWSDV